MNEHNSASTETPEMISLMGYSLAKQSGQFKEGISLCKMTSHTAFIIVPGMRQRVVNEFRSNVPPRNRS
jgi:hypothetical protein